MTLYSHPPGKGDRQCLRRKRRWQWMPGRLLLWTILLAFLLGCVSLAWRMTVSPDGGSEDMQLPVSSPAFDVVVDYPEEDPALLKIPVELAVTVPRLKNEPKVLVFVETQYSVVGREIVVELEAIRQRFRLEVGAKSIPLLTSEDRGKFNLIIFENVERYFRMDRWNRELLDRYCREYHVGIIGFPPILEHTLIAASVESLHLRLHTNIQLRDFELNASSPVLHVTKAEEIWSGILTGEDWTVYIPQHTAYEVVAWARPLGFVNETSFNENEPPKLPAVILDNGKLDRVRRIFFGQSLKFVLHRPLFLDAISFLLNPDVRPSLRRYVQIDIDDIFVGRRGTRMVADDALALIETMERWRKTIPRFRFNLGFSGKYFHAGADDENGGDDMLLANSHKFSWFCHMWGHSQAHLYNSSVEALVREMQFNRAFARDHGIPMNSSYVVSPHHSGVYPVHEPLYEAWASVWNAKVTSTEEYPHFKPMHLHRGFVHHEIMVLPRQTCGLYTHTIFLASYPGGIDRLERSINGGDLFMTLLRNPINVYMTHLSNYAHDRLALYTFESLFNFSRKWTNLELRSAPPLEMAQLYFRVFPQDAEPLWNNPCEDKRHMQIWSATKSCERLPKFLVIGPQKTGTTALYSFLLSHPAIRSTYRNPETFEEVQFFSGTNYYKGLDWYMNFFPGGVNSTTDFLFEKSATYFDNELVPLRAFSLVPHTSIISILIDPVRRAYSWYQHVKAHGDKVAAQYSFLEIVTANRDSPKPLQHLRSRCLRPGEYASHLERWLDHYPSTQLLILDGDLLKSDPVSVMHLVQRFLKIKPFVDYKDLIRFDKKKGFYCQVEATMKAPRCLGRSKGRRYPVMEADVEAVLQRYYQPHNVALHKLLTRLNQPLPLPKWLRADLQ
ncbi:Bifunctional heparan sulfate N-deacetylase/N-sulfotransferase [Hypsibius exemplaris]|uniref:[heparan sulfate]-glucosamine N-sulfotransferase n=1 Tax=Hypsibius exemplaris TaxID=2072580 RepID=A0A1W0WUA7_HYPEX|nr:Bifunctional heparan sulfate N-deacetylase/N-sulfotransferase [Hypsibius exemplaris]